MTADNTGKRLPELKALLKVFTAGLAAIVLLLLIALAWLLATEPGTRWLLKTALSNVDQLDVKQINGTLLNDLSLKQIRYQDANDFAVKIDEAGFKWQFEELFRGHFHIVRLRVEGININGQPAAANDSGSNSEIPHIPLKISIDALEIMQLNWLNGESKTDIQQLSASAILEKDILTFSRLELTMPDLQLTASSEVHMQPDWPLTANLNWSYVVSDATLNGRLSVNGDMKRYLVDSHIQGAVESSQNGYIKLSAEQPEFNLSGQWQNLQWPLAGEVQVSSRRGDFNFHGTPQSYQTSLNADVAAIDQPNFSIAFTGNGNQEGITIEQLLMKPAQGQFNVKGELSWKQAIAFDLILAARQLNPADFGTDIPGKLDIQANGKGSFAGDNFNAELDIEQLSGVIHGQPLNAIGKLTLANQKLDIRRLKISAGHNHLQAKGRLSEQQADLDLQINAPDLSSAWPTLAGTLSGTAAIKGSLNQPKITSNLQGKNLRFADHKIARLSLLVDYAHDSKQQSKLEFLARDLQLAENKINSISLQGNGNQAKHKTRLELLSPLSDIKLDTHGSWNGKQWLGQITRLDINHPRLHQWKLESEAALILSRSSENFKIKLSNSCLVQNQARLCVAAQGSPDTRLDSQLFLSAWPLALTKPWLPDEMTLSGTISAQAQLTSGNNDFTGELNADISEGKALLTDEDNVSHELPFTASTIQLQYQKNRLESNIHFGLGNQDFLSAAIYADKASQNGVRPLSGTIKAHIANMKLIDGLVPEINQLKGLFVADIQISGTSKRPAVTGSAYLQKGQFESAKLGSSFRNIEFIVTSDENDPERLLLNGQIESGQGKLSAEGHLALLATHNYPLHMTLSGEKFQISRLPEAEVIISPTLTINKQGNLTKVDGFINIVKAHVEIKELPENAVVPSEDEVIITDNQTQRKKIDPSRLNTNIDIHLGDNSHFSGFGLETRLAGKLKYIMNQNQQTMQGRAEMQDATYRSYGQNLTIRKGEFLFNGPTDNPWLNIEAVRKAVSEDVTAVLAVTGPLKSPETRVFTEPALPESEALAYLVTGKSIKRMSQSDSSAVASAAFNYGVGQLSWISDQLGIDEFEFEQSDKIEDSAVRLGQYLNPDLYVGVTMGLFANKYEANLRYRLSEHFSVSTRAGETQRIDLKYHLETE